MIREIVTVGLLTGYCFAGEFAMNELMWSNCRADVKLFGKIKQQEYMTLQRNTVDIVDRLDNSIEADFINDE